MRYPTVLFDLDGTLIDSAAIILASMRHATKTVLGREIPDEQLLAGVGSGLRYELGAFDPDRVDELVEAYREHNEPLAADLQPCVAFDTLPELEQYVDVVVGAEDTERHKPHPEPLLTALERLGASARETVYVGDSPFDVRAAKAAGVGAVAVTWGGFHSRERLAQEEPDEIVDTPEELLGRI